MHNNVLMDSKEIDPRPHVGPTRSVKQKAKLFCCTSKREIKANMSKVSLALTLKFWLSLENMYKLSRIRTWDLLKSLSIPIKSSR